jgi:hypothetical protein
VSWFVEYLKSWETNDPEAVAAFACEDVEFEDVGAGHRLVGRDRLAKFAAKSFKLVPGATFDFVDGAQLGDDYHFEWVMQPMGVRGASVGRLRDGKIAWQRDYWNSSHLTLES